MDLIMAMAVGAGLLTLVLFILLIALIATPSRPRIRNVRTNVNSDLNRIKEQINGSDEEEW